ncbi:MAG: hypothetical protein EBT07_15040 [Actinobacteria bacterium]|nr:hypothetical protein [Actinomycetota bacterium]
MPTLGTQNISTSYRQLLKTLGTGGLPTAGGIDVITDGINTSSALSIGINGVQSTGTFNAAGATTLSSSLAVTGAVTLSSSLGVTGAVTFSSSISATTGTATIGTLSASTATISTATIPLQLGSITFGSNITASTGTATIGTESVNVSTIASATFGTARITGSTGGVTAFNYGTAAFTGATLQDLDSITTGSNITTGTFTVSGAAIGDIVFGGLNSLSSSSGTAGVPTAGARMMSQFRVEGANVVRYTILNTDTASHGTIPAGTIYATAMRFIA